MEGQIHNSGSSIQNGLTNSQIAVVMLPLPAQGHINQLVHMSTILTTSYGIPVHFVGSMSHNRQAKVRLNGRHSKTLSNVHFHDLELPPHDSPPPKPDQNMPVPMHVGPLLIATLELRQPFFQLVQKLATNHRRVIVIHDMFMSYIAQDAKLISNVETYALFAFSTYSFFIDSWENIPEKPFELDPDVLIPTWIPSNKFVVPEMTHWAIKHASLWGTESGRIFNTSRLIEGKYVHLLERLSPGIKHFAVGPFNPVVIETSAGENRHACLEWLDKQEKDSVIYISFGTTVSQTDEQIVELAMGLERSEQKFIWVLRRADRGNVFADDDNGDSVPLLPEGFEERVKVRGMVIREYAPQLEILAHESTGGFMSHCGWNSCMETISLGVPIAAWPMHTDQPKNAVLVTEILKIGTMVCDWEHWSELVPSTAVENAVRELMASDEGEAMRKRALKLGEVVQESVAKGGASSLELDTFVVHITRH